MSEYSYSIDRFQREREPESPRRHRHHEDHQRSRSQKRSSGDRYVEYGFDARSSREDARSAYPDPRASFGELSQAPSYKSKYRDDDYMKDYQERRSRSSSVPSKPRTRPSGKKTLFIVTALHPWTGDCPGDLDLKPGDMIKVTEDINAEWLRGSNDKTKEYGVFPKNYVVEIGNHSEYNRKAPPVPSAAPASAPREAPGPQSPQGPGIGRSIGGKLGNAFMFGVGATAGADLVNNLF